MTPGNHLIIQLCVFVCLSFVAPRLVAHLLETVLYVIVVLVWYALNWS